jgi:hypothetical protein
MGHLSNCLNPGNYGGSSKAAYICHSLAIVNDSESGGEAGSRKDQGEIHFQGQRSRSSAEKCFEKRLRNMKTRQDIKQILDLRRVGNVVADLANISMALAPQNQSPFFSEASYEIGFHEAV